MEIRLQFSFRNLSQKVITKNLKLVKTEHRKGRNENTSSFIGGGRKKYQGCNPRGERIYPRVVSWAMEGSSFRKEEKP